MLKVVGQKSMRKSFAEWGYPDWFGIAIGFWEWKRGPVVVVMPADRISSTAQLVDDGSDVHPR